MQIEGWLGIDAEEHGGQVGFFVGPPPAVEEPGKPPFFTAVEDDIASQWVDLQEAITADDLAGVLKPGQYIRATITLVVSGDPISPPLPSSPAR